jgi:hypothetical protein
MQAILRIGVLLGGVLILTLPLSGDETAQSSSVVVELVGAVDRPGGGDPLGIAVAGKYAYVCGQWPGDRGRVRPDGCEARGFIWPAR